MIRHRARGRVWAVYLTAFFLMQMLLLTPTLQAEDEKKSKKLTEEEKLEKEKEEALAREKAFDAYVALEQQKKESATLKSPEQQEALLTELKALQKELLQFPKKDRFRFGQDLHYTYDSNIGRVPIHRRDKGDSIFRINPSAVVDLSGQKTDLAFEYRWNRNYNVKRPESDDFNQEASLRFDRKILPKTNLSLNDRLGRSSVRTQGRDNKKIGWDNSHRATLNYVYNPKITLNLESNYSRTDFGAEAFDETSSLSYSLDPNIAFQLTPKTRFTAGYQWNFTQSPPESSDATENSVRLGYSGRLTPKSSLSADFSVTKKKPDSAQVGKSNTWNSSLGYVWQATPKTSLRTLYSNSYAHSISDSTTSPFIKTDARTFSNTWTLSVRARLHRKLSGEFSFNPSHSLSRTKATGSANTKSQSFTFPFQVAFDVPLNKWMRLRLTYTYRHQIGDEPKTDENRAHTFFVGWNTLV